jgi:hypothetical protein
VQVDVPFSNMGLRLFVEWRQKLVIGTTSCAGEKEKKEALSKKDHPLQPKMKEGLHIKLINNLMEEYQCLHHIMKCVNSSMGEWGRHVRTMCGSRTGGWSLPCVMSDGQRCVD